MPTLRLGDITVTCPKGWKDHTAELKKMVASPPLTLTRASGQGALQFTVMRYQRGTPTEFSAEKLLVLLHQYALKARLGVPDDLAAERAPVQLVAGTFRRDEYRVRVWLVSDGLNFAQATYTVAKDLPHADELAESEAIVRSVRFTAN